MQTPTPPARYDIPWKNAITHALRAFTAFFFADVHARIDWSKRPCFRDKELAKIGFGDAPEHMIAEKRHDPEQLYTDKLRFTGLLFKHRWSRKRIIILFNAMNWMMALSQSDQRHYWQAILQLEEEHNMKLMNSLEQMFFDDGVEKGLEQGLKKGRKEGVIAVLEQQLTQRFGPLPKTLHNKLAKASMEQLTAWAVALPTAQSLKQLFQ